MKNWISKDEENFDRIRERSRECRRMCIDVRRIVEKMQNAYLRKRMREKFN